ncbi:hypothetical protein [Actinoplanes sp. NPDC049802]|uniref:hypothetical protein n=1 Tax=Actinoplanes sp. NPDC049802 TaxID=3154742 RepID=UPI0033E6AA49
MIMRVIRLTKPAGGAPVRIADGDDGAPAAGRAARGRQQAVRRSTTRSADGLISDSAGGRGPGHPS